jgi:hypothetical protein
MVFISPNVVSVQNGVRRISYVVGYAKLGAAIDHQQREAAITMCDIYLQVVATCTDLQFSLPAISQPDTRFEVLDLSTYASRYTTAVIDIHKSFGIYETYQTYKAYVASVSVSDFVYPTATPRRVKATVVGNPGDELRVCVWWATLVSTAEPDATADGYAFIPTASDLPAWKVNAVVFGSSRQLFSSEAPMEIRDVDITEAPSIYQVSLETALRAQSPPSFMQRVNPTAWAQAGLSDDLVFISDSACAMQRWNDIPMNRNLYINVKRRYTCSTRDTHVFRAVHGGYLRDETKYGLLDMLDIFPEAVLTIAGCFMCDPLLSATMSMGVPLRVPYNNQRQTELVAFDGVDVTYALDHAFLTEYHKSCRDCASEFASLNETECDMAVQDMMQHIVMLCYLETRNTKCHNGLQMKEAGAIIKQFMTGAVGIPLLFIDLRCRIYKLNAPWLIPMQCIRCEIIKWLKCYKAS